MLLSQILKEGTKALTGVNDATLKNIEAIKQLSNVTRTSLGPQGMNKMVINKLGKLTITNDASTIVSELEVVHPAAKMVVMASLQQKQEIGDATNLVIAFAGELLSQAEALLRMGLHPTDVIRGYEKALDSVVTILQSCVSKTVKDPKSEEDVASCIKAAISSKVNGYEDFFAPLIAKACISVLPKDSGKFNVDCVRVAKILGGGISDAQLIKGVVIARETEGTIKTVINAKVGVFASGLDAIKTETKGKVYIEKAEDLEKYSNTEEESMETKIKELSDTGVNLVVSGGNVGEMAMHFLEKYNIMVVKVTSKFELRRICQVTNAKPLIRMSPPTPEEIGHVDSCSVEEVGGTRVTIFKQDKSNSDIVTIVVRAATNNILDDLERAIDGGSSVYKSLAKDGRFVAGAGASEIELARQIKSLGDKTPGQDQYAIKKFGEALEVVPRTLAENAGLDATTIITTLYAQHEGGNPNVGVEIAEGGTVDASQKNIHDHLTTKIRAIELATNTVINVLRISQIIMAKPAAVNLGGGPKTDTMGGMDTAEDM